MLEGPLARQTGPVARVLLALSAALLLLGLSLASVSAHANFKRSVPDANSTVDQRPTRVQVWFTEPPDPKRSALQVFDARRQSVASGPTIVDPADPTLLSVPVSLPSDGVYTVAWNTVSATDGDPANGFFAFGAGTAIPGIRIGAGTTIGPNVSLDPSTALGPQLAGDLQVALTLAPGTAGSNVLLVRVLDQGGAPVGGIQRVTLRLETPQPSLGQTEIIAQPAGDGFSAPLLLGLPGNWDLEVQVRRADQDDVSTRFTLPVGEAEPAAEASPGASTAAASQVPAAPAQAASAPTAPPVAPTSATALATTPASSTTPAASNAASSTGPPTAAPAAAAPSSGVPVAPTATSPPVGVAPTPASGAASPATSVPPSVRGGSNGGDGFGGGTVRAAILVVALLVVGGLIFWRGRRKGPSP